VNGKRLRVLCLDIEGGFGGSSRSLYESLRHMDRAAVEPEVWCRRDGPVRDLYARLGIPCRVTAGMPRMNSLARASRNLIGYARCWRAMLLWRPEAARLVDAVRQRFDVVHFNHEGLTGLAGWLRKRHDKAQTMHVRTMIPDNAFGRWQRRRMAASIDRFVFITENERDHIERVLGRGVAGSVIYNAAAMGLADVPRHPAVPEDDRLKIAVLSNFALIRGTDRIVEIAEALAARNRRDVLFVVAGDMTLRDSPSGELGRIARAGGTLADYAAARGVADMFLFLGHVSAPESVLAACQVLLKPTRNDDPWGRDIIEALAAGLPVLSVGRYRRFVESGETGYLMPAYDAGGMADLLIKLHSDRRLIARLGAGARARVSALCDGPGRAHDLLELWRDAVRARNEDRAA
jgi:glycosyltransferase involved in cell wall biosynthesis